jgi:triacylglycerol lipase
VNHLDLVGWVNAARYKWAELRGKEIQFKPATFYLGIADLLAREVEGQAPPERDAGTGADSESRRAAEERGRADVADLGRQVAGEGSSKVGDHGHGQAERGQRSGKDEPGASNQSPLADDDVWDARSEGARSRSSQERR